MRIPNCQVAVVGAGPAGLAAAIRLTELGVDDVVVFEREPAAGGVPRHCGHPPFGLREFQRCYTGPRYAQRLVNQAIAAGVTILTGVTVVALHQGGRLTLSSTSGSQQLNAARVILCTGVRETPRSARLVSGERPAGILTTGALQSMVYLQQRLPCRRPLIVGTELVSFSALLTCRHAGIRPVAMIEKSNRVIAWRGSALLPKLLGVPLYRNTRVLDIKGDSRVESVLVGKTVANGRWIDCDGVVFSGEFTAEASLCRGSHLAIDHATTGPRVDQLGRCSDPAYFATGNLLRPVETAGWCWNEGIRAAAIIDQDLCQPSPQSTPSLPVIIHSDAIKYVMPQVISLPESTSEQMPPVCLQIRFNRPVSGTLQLHLDNTRIASKNISALPERRVLLPITRVSRADLLRASDNALRLTFAER